MSDEPTNEAPHFLICLRAKGIKEAPVLGGVKRVCCRCRAQVWVAPTGLRIQREHGVAFLCLTCGFSDEAVREGIQIHSLTPEQVREIKDAIAAIDKGDHERRTRN